MPLTTDFTDDADSSNALDAVLHVPRGERKKTVRVRTTFNFQPSTFNVCCLFPLLLLTAASLLTGCARVKPWERGTLSDYTMRGDRDPLGDALDEHIYFSREAAYGGRGVGGGGCGCN